MTVSNEARILRFDGNGVTRTFEVTFPFFEVSVYVGGVLQQPNIDYLIVQNYPGSTGSIDFNESLEVSPPPNGADNVVIIGATKIEQTTDYTENNSFPAETLERNLDRLTMALLETAAKVDRAARAKLTDATQTELDLTNADGKILGVQSGQFTLLTATQALGNFDLSDVAQAVSDAEAAAVSAEGSATDAAASAAAAAASAAAAGAATGILSSDAHFTGTPVFELGFQVGKNGGGNAFQNFYDDANDTLRSLGWDNTAHEFVAEDAGGVNRKLWHAGNLAKASQATAEAGTDNNDYMTALRVAQAIAALGGGGTGFPSGTTMFFVNNSAPLGWTADTTHNDKAIRIVNGSVSVGGSLGFSSCFASRTPAGTISGTTLDTSRIPSHTHTEKAPATGAPKTSSSGSYSVSTGSGADVATGSTGGGGSHDHVLTGSAMNFNVAYVDTRMATKD